MQKNETRSPTYTINKNKLKVNLKWIKDLNISCNMIKVLEENIGRKISDIPRSNILTDMSPKVRDIKERINGTSSKYKASAWLKKTALK